MFILWIKKRKASKNSNHINNEGSPFQRHDEDMKTFFAGHPDADTLSEDDIVFAEGNSLLPVHKVKLADNIQN